MKYLLILGFVLSLVAVVFTQSNTDNTKCLNSCIEYSFTCKDGSESKSTCVARSDGTCANAVPVCPDVIPEPLPCTQRLRVLPDSIDHGRKLCEYDNLCRLQFGTTCDKRLAYARCVEPTKELCLQAQVCAKRDTRVESLTGEFLLSTDSQQGNVYPNVIFPTSCVPLSVAAVDTNCCPEPTNPCDLVDCAAGYHCTLDQNKTRAICNPIPVDPVQRDVCSLITPDTPNAAEVCQKTTSNDGTRCQPIFGTTCKASATDANIREIDNTRVFVECRRSQICTAAQPSAPSTANTTIAVIRPVCAVNPITRQTLLFDNLCQVGANWKPLDDPNACCKIEKECNCIQDNQYCDRLTGECREITPCATISCKEGSRCVQNADGTYGCTTTQENTACAHLDNVDFSARCTAPSTNTAETITIARRFLGFGIIGGKVQPIYGCSDMGYKLFASEEEIYRACVCNPRPIKIYNASNTIVCITTTLLGYRANPDNNGKCGEYIECTVPNGLAVTTTLEECQKRCENIEVPNPCSIVLCAPGSTCSVNKDGRAECTPIEKPTCKCKEGEKCVQTERGEYCTIDRPDCSTVKCPRGTECRLDENKNPFCDPFDCATCLGDSQKCIRGADGSAKCVDDEITCANVKCAPGLKCVETVRGPSCVKQTCEDIKCERGQVCVARDNGAVTCVDKPIIRCPPIELVKTTADAVTAISDFSVDKISPVFVDCTLTGSYCAEDTPGRPYCTDPTKPQYCSITGEDGTTVVAKPGTAFRHPDGCNWCKCLESLEYGCTDYNCTVTEPIDVPDKEDYTCATHVCPRGQTCSINKRGVPECTCPEGTTGDFCQYKVCDKDNDCNDDSSFCLRAADPTVKPRCKCPPGFLVTVRGCIPVVVEDDIVCGKDEVTNNELRCVCKAGYERKNGICVESVRDDIIKRVIRRKVVPALEDDEDINELKFHLAVALKTDISTIDVKIIRSDANTKGKKQSDESSTVEIALAGNDNETPSNGDASNAGPYTLSAASDESDSMMDSSSNDGTNDGTVGDAEESSASSLFSFFF